MDENKRESGGDGDHGTETEKTKSAGEELKKCLEENKGDSDKCKSMAEAFKSTSSSISTKKPIAPLRLRSGH